MTRTLASLAALALAGFSSALTLTTPFDLGYTGTASALNGSTVTLLAPSLISAAGSEATLMQAMLAGSNTPRTDSSTAITLGGTLAGNVAVRSFDAGTFSALPYFPGDYFGASARLDLDGAPNQADLRWVVNSSYTALGDPHGSFLFTSAFANDRPYYYDEATDLGQRGTQGYTLDTNIYWYSESPVNDGMRIWELDAFPVLVVQDASGLASSITIYDGVRLPAAVTVVPEPASLAVLGVGAAALLRRRRRS